MSEPIDDKALDEYLSGRSQISQHYRALADGVRDTVPPELDRRILAQARDAVAQAEAAPVDGLARLRTKRRRLMQWGVPAALAASAVLVVSIVIQSGVQHEVRAVNEHPVAAPAAAAPPPPAVMIEPQITSASEPESAIEVPPPPAAKQAPKVRQVAPPAPAPAAMADSLEQRARAAAPQATSPAEDPARYKPTATSPRAERERDDIPKEMSANRQSSMVSAGSIDLHGDPQRWLEHIRELRRNGKQVEADSDWKQFRVRYPDYPVAETDAAVSKPESKP